MSGSSGQSALCRAASQGSGTFRARPLASALEMVMSVLDPDLLERLRGTTVPTLVSTLYRKGYANTMLRGVKPQGPLALPMVGTAFTLRTVAMREDQRLAIEAGTVPNLHPAAMEQVGAGEVLVCGAAGVTDTALLGDILSTAFMVRGVAGVVTDGSVSDGAAIAQIPLPVFARGDAATTFLSHRHIVELNVPIDCAGVPVFPGDVLVGDENGVVCIPRHEAQTVAEIAAEREIFESFVLERVRAGIPLAGTYPPDEATQAAYRAWLSARDSAASPRD
ncbi:MAG: ribonuclease activity regulator RraA [Geminicoccaceae bacterium]|nr:MAG: ribonuclease activity regulator RraA [Geminicoccaceae bacterium]